MCKKTPEEAKEISEQIFNENNDIKFEKEEEKLTEDKTEKFKVDQTIFSENDYQKFAEKISIDKKNLNLQKYFHLQSYFFPDQYKEDPFLVSVPTPVQNLTSFHLPRIDSPQDSNQNVKELNFFIYFFYY